jgi:hypothetical protein
LTSYPQTFGKNGIAARFQADPLWRVALLIIVSVSFGSLLGAFTGQKVTFLFKEELHLSVSEVGTLGILLGIPAYLQFFMGAWADLRPLFGYHRRSYYVLACLLEIAGFLGLAFLHQYQYAMVACLLLVTGAGGVLLGVVFNAVMVTVGNPTGSFGSLQSLARFVPIVLSIVYVSGLSGRVLEHWSYRHSFLMAALLCLLRIPVALLIDEKRVARRYRADETKEERKRRLDARQADRERTARALRQAAATPGLWAMVAFIFYLILTPGIFTAETYYMKDVLHLSKQFIGDLAKWRAGGVLIALIAFGLASRRLPVRSLVWGAWIMDCVSYPALLLLHNGPSAQWVSLLSVLIGTLYGLCLTTLAARACPRGIEGTVYGLVMASIALGGTLSEKFGGILYDYFGPLNTTHHYTITHGWVWALWIGFGFTVIAAVFIPFLPAWARSSAPLRMVNTEAVVTAGEEPAHTEVEDVEAKDVSKA